MANFGKYELLERLASGGMAELFLARQTGVGGFSKTVVIKRIHKHLSSDYEFTTMFVNEARVSAQLSHQNIVQIYDFGEQDGSYYIAMEFVSGQDLKNVYKVCRKKRIHLPLPLAIYVIQQVSKGLDYAHRKKDSKNNPLDIVHRDVSPQNVLISYEGEVKVADFGIAKAAGASRMTQAGTLKGKIAYMSPEQAWAKPVDRRSDVFSIGIVFWEILTNQRLFFGNSDFDTLEKVRNCEIPDILQILPSLSKEVERILRKALAKEPTARYQSAAEMHHDLEVFSAAHGFYNQSPELANFLRTHFLQEEENKAKSSLDISDATTEEAPSPLQQSPPEHNRATAAPPLPVVAQQIVARAQEAVKQPAQQQQKAPSGDDTFQAPPLSADFKTVISQAVSLPPSVPPQTKPSPSQPTTKPPSPPPGKPKSITDLNASRRKPEIFSASSKPESVANKPEPAPSKPESSKKPPVAVKLTQPEEELPVEKRPTRPLQAQQPNALLEVNDPRRPTRALPTHSGSKKLTDPSPVASSPENDLPPRPKNLKPPSNTKKRPTVAVAVDDDLLDDLPLEKDTPPASSWVKKLAVALFLAVIFMGGVLFYMLREKGLLLPPSWLPPGSIEIQSLPDATVFLENNPQGKTKATGNLLLSEILSNTYNIKISKPGFADLIKTTKVSPRKTAFVEAYPDPLLGSLSIRLNEPSARIYINGAYYGRTDEEVALDTEKNKPLQPFVSTLEMVPADLPLIVVAAKPNNRFVQGETKVSNKNKATLDLNFPPVTLDKQEKIEISVMVNQPQAFAILDGNLEAVVDDPSKPLLLKTEQGIHELVIVKAGFDPIVFQQKEWTKQILKADLKPAEQTGAIQVATFLEGYRILIDGREILRGVKGTATIPGIPQGKHWVSIQHPSIKTMSKEVKVQPGKDKLASVNFLNVSK